MVKNVFGKIKSLFNKVRRDELAGLTEEQKGQLENIERQRRFELIAANRLRKLEEKLSPKPKKTASDVFAEIKKFRETNLRRRAERISRVETAKKKFKSIEEMRKERNKITPRTEKRKPFTTTRLGRL